MDREWIHWTLTVMMRVGVSSRSGLALLRLQSAAVEVEGRIDSLLILSCAGWTAPSPAQWEAGISSAACAEQEEGCKILPG